jgi:hypothetical protein
MPTGVSIFANCSAQMAKILAVATCPTRDSFPVLVAKVLPRVGPGRNCGRRVGHVTRQGPALRGNAWPGCTTGVLSLILLGVCVSGRGAMQSILGRTPRQQRPRPAADRRGAKRSPSCSPTRKEANGATGTFGRCCQVPHRVASGVRPSASAENPQMKERKVQQGRHRLRNERGAAPRGRDQNCSRSMPVPLPAEGSAPEASSSATQKRSSDH